MTKTVCAIGIIAGLCLHSAPPASACPAAGDGTAPVTEPVRPDTLQDADSGQQALTRIPAGAAPPPQPQQAPVPDPDKDPAARETYIEAEARKQLEPWDEEAAILRRRHGEAAARADGATRRSGPAHTGND